jgi:HAD superfamily hydrolase (TIGR01509 family)
VFKHVIFDCDGVLVDSEPLSMRADVEIVRRFGINITPEEAGLRFIGATFEAMLDTLAQEHKIQFPHGLSAEKDRRLEELFRKDLRIVPGVRESLAALADRGVTCSVASNSPRQRVELALSVTGITGHFTAITTYENVPCGKPAPDVYLEAVERSGFSAHQCCVVEDSTTGVTSAVAAHLNTFGFTGTHHEPHHQAQKLLAIGAIDTFETMSDLLKRL